MATTYQIQNTKRWQRRAGDSSSKSSEARQDDVQQEVIPRLAEQMAIWKQVNSTVKSGPLLLPLLVHHVFQTPTSAGVESKIGNPLLN